MFHRIHPTKQINEKLDTDKKFADKLEAVLAEAFKNGEPILVATLQKEPNGVSTRLGQHNASDLHMAMIAKSIFDSSKKIEEALLMIAFGQLTKDDFFPPEKNDDAPGPSCGCTNCKGQAVS